MSDQVYGVGDPNFWVTLNRVWPGRFHHISAQAQEVFENLNAKVLWVEYDPEMSFVIFDLGSHFGRPVANAVEVVLELITMMNRLGDPELRIDPQDGLTARWR